MNAFSEMIGDSYALRAARACIEAIAGFDVTVLIEGESGTGKELAAQALHRRSHRAAQKLVSVNCATLSESLLGSELFGFVKGAFTGASTTHQGLFEVAHRGTIFLDEVTELSPKGQAMLLRVLQEGELRRVGATDAVPIDTRVIVATNRPLRDAVEKGAFREDLYYRLSVVSVQLPALHERRDDIPSLVEHFIAKHVLRFGRTTARASEQALAMLSEYEWPGNVRELENAVQHALLCGPGEVLEPEHFPRFGRTSDKPLAFKPDIASLTSMSFSMARKQVLREFERTYVTEALRTSGSISGAARLAHVDRSNFKRLLRQHLTS